MDRITDEQKHLADTVKKAREKSELTQIEVASIIGASEKTVLNLENYRGNPRFDVLYPLVRALHIDAHELFHPEKNRESFELHHLHAIIDECSDEEARELIPIVDAVLSISRKNKQ